MPPTCPRFCIKSIRRAESSSSDCSTSSSNTEAPPTPVNSSLTRKTMKSTTWLKHIMVLPKLPNTRFEVNPAEKLSERIVNEQFNKIWANEDHLEAFELNTDRSVEDQICKGIPTMAMAKAAEFSMRWNLLIQAGICTPTYANDKFALQLTNASIVAVLLAAVATSALVTHPNFSAEHSSYPQPLPELFQCFYFFFMISSAMSCLAAASIALHSVNRISNVCPSKSSVTYMTVNVFFSARDAVNTYTFRGMLFACCGLISGFIWINQNVLWGVPAAFAACFATGWFVVIYKKWEMMTMFHSDVADKLCAKDLMIAAENGHSITDGIWSV